MIKWIKRIILGFLSTITILILLLVVIKPKPYYIINCIIGNQIQWFGYNLEGNEMIDKSIKKIKNFSASGYHIFNSKYKKW